MKRLIVANWKLNPQTYQEAEKLARTAWKAAKTLKNVDVVICPPFVWLQPVNSKFEIRNPKLSLGSQDVFWKERGAYTGEVSPAMLKNLGATWVIIGHSERRQNLGETDEMINKKAKAVLAAGLKVILCVGETLQERRRGQTKVVLRRQLKKGLAQVSKLEIRNLKLRDRFVVAYEPVWAIGSGFPETSQNAESAALFIKAELSKLLSARKAKDIRVIYGGSVNSKNISGYIVMPAIAGALVGGASLKPKEFIRMLEISDRFCYNLS
jgi:triosephosphate isomerase